MSIIFNVEVTVLYRKSGVGSTLRGSATNLFPDDINLILGVD